MAESPVVEQKLKLVELAAQIVAAYVARNAVPLADVPRLIAETHRALRETLDGTPSAGEPAEPAKPAVSVRKSVTPEFIICLEDGKKFKSLKRHLRSHYDLSPEQYREKWNLPADYPMVAPRYAEKRSSLAKSMGLGQRTR